MEKLRNYPLYRHRCSRACVEYILIPKSASNSIRRALNSGGIGTPCYNPFVFSFVRHPLARLISAYVEKVQTGKTKILMPKHTDALPTNISLPNFVDFLVNFEDNNKELLNDHFCPQSWILNNVPKLDFVGCVENMEEDWKVLQERGLPNIQHKHKTEGIQKWQQMLDKETEAKAREYYRDDFEKWPNFWE